RARKVRRCQDFQSFLGIRMPRGTSPPSQMLTKNSLDFYVRCRRPLSSLTSSPLSISCQSHLNLTWVRASSPELAAASRASFLPSRAFDRPPSDLPPSFRASRRLQSLQPPADLLPTSR